MHEHYNGQEHWMNDCFDFSLDIYNSIEQRNHMVCRSSQETLTYRQYQYRFGGNETTLVIRINDPDPAWESKNDCGAWVLKYNQVSVTEAHQNYGILFEVFPAGEHRKAQEWLIPWSEIGSGVSIPSTGQKLAITMSYNDMDMSAIGRTCLNPDCLFLRDRGNQFVNRPEFSTDPNYCRSGTNWGDIEFGGKLDEISGPSVAVSPRHAALRSLSKGAMMSMAAVERYAVNGRRLAGSVSGLSGAAIIERVSAHGTSALVVRTLPR
jgi:hypothetical protein